MRAPDSFRLAQGAAVIGPAILREIFDLAVRPGVISFAIGLPATSLFPAAELAHEAAELFSRRPEALQYGLPSPTLKSMIVDLMAHRGVVCSPRQIFLTAGAQQGMDLLAHLLLDPGGQVMCESTVYECAQGMMRKFLPEVLTVPTDPERGLDVDAVATHLAAGARPAFLYTIPTGHNPLGVSLDIDRRQALVALAKRYRMPIIEDDAYGFLDYGSAAAPALRSFEERWVLYLGSFSKILTPALRVGWIVLPEELLPPLQALKHGHDIDTSTVGQGLVAAYLAGGHLPAHLELVRAVYRQRRDVALRAMAEHFPTGVRWNKPTGGMFLWVELPSEVETAALLRSAVETEQVAFSPGRAFAAGNGRHADSCLRLSFVNLSPEEIEEGIRRLAQAVRRVLGR
jgi:2-aminoadipate transaminase